MGYGACEARAAFSPGPISTGSINYPPSERSKPGVGATVLAFRSQPPVSPNTAATANGGGDAGNLAEQVVNSALRYRGQAPLIDAILNEVGMSGGDLNGLTQALQGGGAAKAKPASAPAAPESVPGQADSK